MPKPESREPITHELKTWPDYFQAVKRGDKRFELRRNDRDFRVGDTLRLREYCPVDDAYSGDECSRVVTFALDAGLFDIPGVSVLSLADPTTPDTARREALIALIRQHVKADATGLAPAVIGHYLFGFEEAADAILSTEATALEEARARVESLEIGVHQIAQLHYRADLTQREREKRASAIARRVAPLPQDCDE